MQCAVLCRVPYNPSHTNTVQQLYCKKLPLPTQTGLQEGLDDQHPPPPKHTHTTSSCSPAKQFCPTGVSKQVAGHRPLITRLGRPAQAEADSEAAPATAGVATAACVHQECCRMINLLVIYAVSSITAIIDDQPWWTPTQSANPPHEKPYTL